jgi:hypothetical protein
MVFNDRPTYKDRPARNSSWPGELISTKGRIHLRRLVFSTKAFPLQSCGGPYIPGTNTVKFLKKLCGEAGRIGIRGFVPSSSRIHENPSLFDHCTATVTSVVGAVVAGVLVTVTSFPALTAPGA